MMKILGLNAGEFNTSASILKNGEPIVNNPDDAINTFLKIGLDTLIIEDFLVKKK